MGRKITPRYGSLSSAAKFKFSSSNDYNSNMLKHCSNFQWRFPGHQDWYTEPKAKNLDKKLSVYWSVSVGDNPHPNPKPFTRIAILMNSNGAYHHWTHGGPKAYYDRPRFFNNDGKFQNFLLGGQSWGVHNYDDIGALLEYADMRTNIGTDTIRICNLGPKNIYVKAIYGVLHGTIKNNPQTISSNDLKEAYYLQARVKAMETSVKGQATDLGQTKNTVESMFASLKTTKTAVS